MPCRVLPRRARSREPADRGVAKALRIVAEFEALSSEQRLSLRTGGPCGETGLAAHLIETDEAREPPQVQTDDRAVRASIGVESADHARSAPERNHGDPQVGAHAEQRRDLIVASWQHDGIRRRLFPLPPSEQIRLSLIHI